MEKKMPKMPKPEMTEYRCRGCGSRVILDTREDYINESCTVEGCEEPVPQELVNNVWSNTESDFHPASSPARD
jgi:hypothetical protein